MAYISTCIIDAQVTTESGEYAYASDVIKFYHVGSQEMENLSKCNPKALLKQIESEFRENPVYYKSDRA